MIRSRRLALAAVVVVLGLSACGDPNTTAPLADQPQVIQLASGQTGTGAAPAAESMDMDAADTKMAFFGPTEFVYDGELPALDVPAGSWFYPTGAQPDLDRIATLAAALGVQGEVRTLTEEQGGGWAVGPEDYSAAVLSVGSDGMLSWWLSAAPTTGVGYACGVSIGVSEPAVGADDTGNSGVVTDVPPPAYTDSDEETPVAVDAVATTIAGDVVAPDCPTPEPPVGIPTKDEALAKAKQLFADWGYDVNSYQFDDPYADEWGASVFASLLLDGMKAPITLSVGFGENGAVTYASGSLAEPQRGADYPTIGAAAGLERLKTQQNQYTGLLGSPEARSAVDVGSSDAGVATAVAPDIAPCEPEPASADCAPVDSEPITVTLNSVKSDLTMVWAADNTIWLLPAYSFGSADGGIYTVIAVEDAYIHQADPVPATGTDPAVDPGVAPTPQTAPPVPADGGTCTTLTEITEPPASVEQIADAVVGYCLVDAQDLAKAFGYEVRVVRQDGVDLAVTDDFSEARINVATKGDIVAEVVSIG